MEQKRPKSVPKMLKLGISIEVVQTKLGLEDEFLKKYNLKN